MKKLIMCLMGPTATGKTDLAIQLAQQFPIELISVDSTLVYKGMDIGTAKPDKEYPHYLIDICNPDEVYSAGQFCKDAIKIIEKITQKNKIPLLVGGTMLYFRALQNGLAELPTADNSIREKIKDINNPHEYLKKIDPPTAKRLHPNDTQRIERAIEVYEITHIPLSEFHKNNIGFLEGYEIISIGLIPDDREKLKTRIEQRFHHMLKIGLMEEVQKLLPYKDYPALKSVGYKEVIEYLMDNYNKETMIEKAIIATQQLAKRQLTWLRTWPNLNVFDPDSPTLLKDLAHFVQTRIAQSQKS